MNEALRTSEEIRGSIDVDIPALRPLDEYNRLLQAHAHPPNHENPTPSGRYHLVVIGAGTAGLVTAAGAAGLGARVALVERDLMGGDCLNVGCVPSKALIRCARAAADVRDAGEYGVHVSGDVRVDFGEIMSRMRRLRAGIAPHDSVKRFSELGIDVFIGQAEFQIDETIRVGEATLHSSRAVIATGARAVAPAIPGLEETGYLTNETIFSLTELPRRMVIIGAGPIGCEMAQSFARFGSEVTLLEAGDHILAREDRDAAQIVDASLRRDGVDILIGAEASQVRTEGATKIVTVDMSNEQRDIPCDAILVGVGRQPNVDGLNLDAVSVAYDERQGVHVDDRLRTTNRRIFAAGDICSKYKFTHTADAMARIVIRNALFFGRAKVSDLTMPWCTYTDPEIAHVGLYEHDAKSLGIDTQTFTIEMKDVDRAILEGETDGLLKVHVKKGSDRILGATLVARHAGEMISELTLAMVSGKGLRTISSTIHPYPTQAEAIRKVGDLYNRSRLTPTVSRLMRTFLSFRR